MEPVTRQITSQSNKSIFVVALDQDGPMVSHTMETINHHDTSDDDDFDHHLKRPSKQLSLSSDITIQQEEVKSVPPPPPPPPGRWKNPFRSKRRSSSDEPKPDPRQFSRMKKNMILMIVAAAGAS
jgi:hypothetical protein